MAMFTLHVNGSEVKLATNKLQFGTPSFVDLSPLKIKCERATTAEASKNAAAFDYEDMTQTQIDGAYVTPTYLAIKETEGSNRGIIAYSFTMKLTHRDGASSHDDQ